MVMWRRLERWSTWQSSYLAMWTTVDVMIFVFRTRTERSAYKVMTAEKNLRVFFRIRPPYPSA
jgi:hypothetical protein